MTDLLTEKQGLKCRSGSADFPLERPRWVFGGAVSVQENPS